MPKYLCMVYLVSIPLLCRHENNVLVLTSHTYMYLLYYQYVFCLLIGVYDKGAVEVTNCFTVPHNESEDEVII